MSTPDDALATPDPPTVPNRVLDVGDIVTGSMRTLRAAPAVFLGLPLLIVVPVLALAVVLIALAGTAVVSDGPARSITSVAAVLVAVLGSLAILYAVLRVSGATAVGAYQVALGARPSLRSLWHAAGGVVWRLLALALLGALTIFVVVGVLGAIATAIATAGHEGWAVALLLLLMLAALPVYVFLAVKLAFVVQVIALEKAGPIGALRRSWALTRGQWWPVFGRLVLLYLLGIPISLLPNLVAAPAGLLEPDADRVLTWAVLPALAVALVLVFLYSAYSAVYLSIMYLDARRREDARFAVPPPGSPGPALAYPYGATPPPPGVSPFATPPAPDPYPAPPFPDDPPYPPALDEQSQRD